MTTEENRTYGEPTLDEFLTPIKAIDLNGEEITYYRDAYIPRTERDISAAREIFRPRRQITMRVAPAGSDQIVTRYRETKVPGVYHFKNSIRSGGGKVTKGAEGYTRVLPKSK